MLNRTAPTSSPMMIQKKASRATLIWANKNGSDSSTASPELVPPTTAVLVVVPGDGVGAGEVGAAASFFLIKIGAITLSRTRLHATTTRCSLYRLSILTSDGKTPANPSPRASTF